MGSEIFLSEISSQVKYNFKIKLYYVKIQQNIARATSNEIKISKFQNNIFFKLITCLVHSNCPVIIITSHLLFLKVHFLVKPNAYLLGKFAAVRTPIPSHIDLAGNTSYHFAASCTVFPRVSPYHGPGL